MPPLGPPIPFPGHVLSAGDSDREVVRDLQRRLNATGCGPIPENGTFEQRTTAAVRLFQMRFSDVTGRPLVVDGKVGAITWGALFGPASVPSNTTPPSALTKTVIEFAFTQVGVMEKPPGSNRGPEVDDYLRAVDVNPADGSSPWCVAFTHFCYRAAAQTLGIPNPHIRTAGVLDHWNRAASKTGVLRITNKRATADPSLVRPGALFIIGHANGTGHSGIVVETANGRLVTIEGNTNDNGSREGIGVFRREARKIADITKGFIDYGGF